MTSYNKFSLQHCTVIFVSIVWAYLSGPQSTIFPSNSLVCGRKLHKKAGAANHPPPPPPPPLNTGFGEAYPDTAGFGEAYPDHPGVTHITPGSVIALARPELEGGWAIRATTAGMCVFPCRGFLVSGPDNTPDTDDFVPVVFRENDFDPLTRESNWVLDQLRTLRSSEIPLCTRRLKAVLTEIQPAACPTAEDMMGADGSEDSCLAGRAAAACPVAAPAPATAPAGPVANSSSVAMGGTAAAEDSSSSSSDEDSTEEDRPEIAEQAAAEGGAVAANVLASARGLTEDDEEDQLPTKVIYSAEGQWDLMLNPNVRHWPTELYTFVRDRTDWEYRSEIELFAFDKLEVRESSDGSTRAVRILIDENTYVEIRVVSGARISYRLTKSEGLKSSVEISFSPDSEDGSSSHTRGATLLPRNPDPTDVSKENEERMAGAAIHLQSILLGFGGGAEAVCPAPEDVTGADGSVDDWLAGGAAAACPVPAPAPVAAPAGPVASSSSSSATGRAAAEDSSSSSSSSSSDEEDA